MGNETQFVIPFPVYSHYHEQDEEKLRNPVVRLPEVVEGKLGGFDNWGPAAKAGETEHEVTAEVQLFDDRGCDSVQQHVQRCHAFRTILSFFNMSILFCLYCVVRRSR